MGEAGSKSTRVLGHLQDFTLCIYSTKDANKLGFTKTFSGFNKSNHARPQITGHQLGCGGTTFKLRIHSQKLGSSK
jgi:hypothetical protein